MFKTAYLQKRSITWKFYDRFFSNFSKYVSELYSFITASLKSVVTAVKLFDCCTKCWSNLTVKCNINAFVKVDAKIKK